MKQGEGVPKADSLACFIAGDDAAYCVKLNREFIGASFRLCYISRENGEK